MRFRCPSRPNATPGQLPSGRRLEADEVAVYLPGRLCLEPAPGGWRVTDTGHRHAVGEPCAIVRRGTEIIDCPNAVRYLDKPARRLFQHVRGASGRVLYEETP